MFNDDLEELITFFTEKVKENKKEKEEEREEDEERLQKYINRIRHVSCSRVNKRRSSPMMMGRIMGRSSNKQELFIANTGISVIILPINIARCGHQLMPTNQLMLVLLALSLTYLGRPTSGQSSTTSREDTNSKY